MVKVKICGITNLEDALNAVEAGCDGLGFVFYRKSPRYISPGKAGSIIKNLPSSVMKIGVFVNAQEKTIKKIAEFCNLDLLQFHGNESPEFCARFKTCKIIKVFRIENKVDLEDIKRYKVFAYLFDTFSKSSIGGTGRKFNWKRLKSKLPVINKPIFLSGGLNRNNVLEAIRLVSPDWVDVSSSLEIKPGIKDRVKVKKFIETAKNGG
jgi:phosphoribosylanthranilate isomerase